MRKHPGRVASKWGTPTGGDDYTVIFAPALLAGAFSFLKFLEAVEVILWDELATGAAAAWGGGRRGVESVDP